MGSHNYYRQTGSSKTIYFTDLKIFYRYFHVLTREKKTRQSHSTLFNVELTVLSQDVILLFSLDYEELLAKLLIFSFLHFLCGFTKSIKDHTEESHSALPKTIRSYLFISCFSHSAIMKSAVSSTLRTYSTKNIKSAILCQTNVHLAQCHVSNNSRTVIPKRYAVAH